VGQGGQICGGQAGVSKYFATLEPDDFWVCTTIGISVRPRGSGDPVLGRILGPWVPASAGTNGVKSESNSSHHALNGCEVGNAAPARRRCDERKPRSERGIASRPGSRASKIIGCCAYERDPPAHSSLTIPTNGRCWVKSAVRNCDEHFSSAPISGGRADLAEATTLRDAVKLIRPPHRLTPRPA
jgi:hypothetical protein